MAEPDDGVLTALLLAFRDFAQPVIDACASPEAMEFFWYRHGWRISLDDGGFAQLSQVLPIGPVGRELEQIADAVAGQRDSGSPPSPDDVLRLADAVATLAETLAVLKPTSVANLAGALGEAATWDDLGEQLFDTLLEQYLREHHPIPYLILLVTGCLRYEATPAAPPSRNAFVRAVFDWNQPRALLRDPVAALAATYRWGDPSAPFDHQRLLDVLGRVLRPLGVETDLITPALQLEPGLPAQTVARIRTDVDALRVTILHGVALDQHVTYEVGFDLLPAGPAAGGPPSGLVLRPRLKGGVTKAIPIGGSFTLRMSVEASAGDVLGISLLPGDASLTGGDVTVGTAVELATSAAHPFYLVGTAGSPRIELRNPSIRVSLEGTAEDAELRLRIGTVDAAGGGAGPGARVVIPMSQSDSFVKELAGSSEIQISFSLEVIWSSATGFAVNGSATPKIDLPLSIKVGSFTLRNASIALLDATSSGGRTAYQLRVGTDIAGSIGPVAVVVQGLGFAVDLVPYSREELRALPAGAPRPALGNLDVDLSFAPPTGLGLSIDAGPVTGGGFLSFAPERQEYAGALELQFGTIGVKAIGLLSTGPGDWSLLLLLYAQIPPIEIGFGFMLEGIGGMIGLQRGVDITALIAGMKTKEFDDILFPADPVGDAPRILNTLRTLFPARAGALTIGPMIDVGWGTPRIVFIRVAVLLQLDNVFGSSGGQVTLTRVVLVGQVRVVIGRTDDDSGIPVVLLIVDIVGFWDLADKRYGFLAVLRDSHITGIDITGGLGVWGEYGDHSRFLLAAGGFNPRFHDVPTEMSGTLDRLGASFSVGRFSLVMTGYFALTPATLQAGMNLVASAKIGPVGLKGEIGFDVLVYRTPRTHFIADFRMTAEVTYHGHTLAGVKVTGTLEGPGLWHLKGEVTFSILWWDISKSFNESWGIEAALELTLINLQTLLTAELTRRENWSAQLPAGAEAMVTLAPHPGDLTPRAHPLGRFVFSQRVTPLGLTLEKYGDSAITGPNHFEVTSVTLSGTRTIPVVEYTPVGEHFARAQFLEMTDEEKLTRPSFEEMDSGVEFSSAAFEINAPAAVGATMDYETAYLDFQTQQTRRDLTSTLKKAALDYEFLEALAQSGAAARAPQRASEQMRTKTALRIAVGPPPLAATDRSTFAVDPTVAMSGQAGSVQMIAEQRLRTVGAAGSQIIEAFELTGP